MIYLDSSPFSNRLIDKQRKNLLPAAQSVRPGGHPLLESRQLQSVNGDKGRIKCARRVPGRSH